MGTDDRREIILARAERLKGYRESAGFGRASEAARRYRWVEVTYRSHENGTRSIGDDDADRYAAAFSRPGRRVTGKDIMYGPSDHPAEPTESGVTQVPVVGLIGAGGDIEPEYEQVPEEGLFTVQLPFGVPVDLIAFQVKGTSMMPKYEEGDVILVWREQRRALESFYGKEAAVRTADGRRYLKTILYGKTRAVVNLQSFNDRMIEGVRIEWIGEIYCTIRADQVHRAERRIRARKEARRSLGRESRQKSR